MGFFSVSIFQETTSNYYRFQFPFKQEYIIEGKERYLIENLKQPETWTRETISDSAEFNLWL